MPDDRRKIIALANPLLAKGGTPTEEDIRAACSGNEELVQGVQQIVSEYTALKSLAEGMFGTSDSKIVTPDAPSASPRVSATHSDLELLIREIPNTTPVSYKLELHAPDPDLEINHITSDPIVLKSDPARYVAGFFKKIQDLPDGRRSLRDIARELKDLGSSIYQELIPSELGKVLGRFLGDEACTWTLQIQSDEPWIPWELLRFPPTQGYAPFLCEAFAISRWLGRRPPLRRLPLRRMAVVAPRYEGLPWVARELQFLFGLNHCGREVNPVDVRKENLLKVMAAAFYDSWHFSGHGLFKDDPNCSEILLEDYEKLTPVNLSGDAKELGVARPLVFLNGCHTGRTGMSLTAVGGWADAFLKAGAGAFLGAYWAISDDRAASFAREFYTTFLNGTGIAEAVRQARLSIRTPDDPTWLAYTVYAHPLAFCPGQDESEQHKK